jgi:hypothetical protein
MDRLVRRAGGKKENIVELKDWAFWTCAIGLLVVWRLLGRRRAKKGSKNGQDMQAKLSLRINLVREMHVFS